MMDRTLVKVTAKHIKAAKAERHEGIKELGESCPIAQALTALGNTNVFVTTNNARVGNSYYPLPRSARRFVARFDSNKPVKPFSFYLGAKKA